MNRSSDSLATQEAGLLVIGAGHAGGRAAQAARAVNPQLRIVVIGEEMHGPYERPPLSKDALLDPATSADSLASPEDWARQRIELQLGVAVANIDATHRCVTLADGSLLHYDNLILATGSRPRPLAAEVDPQRLALYVRTREDSQALAARLRQAKKLVVIGAGFIGLEVAAMARKLGVEVCVLERDSRSCARALPGLCSSELEKLHRDNGVEMRFDAQLVSIERTSDGRARLHTSQGAIDADVVVAGIGVLPNVELATAAGLAVDNGILVDATGQTSNAHIWAAGEVARHPVKGDARLLRLESWQVAEQQARAVGATAAGVRTEHLAWPWFWSDQYDLNLQCLGNTSDESSIVVRTGPKGEQTHFFLDAQDRLRGVIALNAGRDIGAARRLMDKGVSLAPAALRNINLPWQQWTAS